MSADRRQAASHLERLLSTRNPEELLAQLAPHPGAVPPKVPGGAHVSDEAVQRRWDLIPAPDSRRELLDADTEACKESYKKNIEHFIGTVKVPVGLAGPLRVNGLFASGDYYVPLATTEAALVASYSRGSHLLTEAGGCTSAVLNEGVCRSPGFAFRDLRESGLFVLWTTEHLDEFRRVAEATTRFGKLTDMRITLEGNHVYLCFEFTTGDASGQNMVTLATEAICAFIEEHCPITPQYHFVEANLSGDKKASAQSFLLVRGRKVSAEALVPAELIEKRLRTTPEQMVNFWRMCAMGGILSGTMGIQGHFANGLTALYMACGQDVACVAESAVGVCRYEVMDGNLYASVSLPNIMVGTVGGGTGLPSQKACLDILGLSGAGKAQALAEVCAGLCLAGELSIMGAMCSGDFSRAHRLLARGKHAKKKTEGNAHE
ncbi:MAG: hydroxymethylglutaryl-CoA reductase [Planctomycetes bacterium]|nr:hydroxymethylglutaryl-CoA reductase [Planctomycetota bacterium]